MSTHVSRILNKKYVVILTVRAASSQAKNVTHYPMVVLGGGAGGSSVAARACRFLGKGNVAVVDPAKYHFYQPMWTLVGAGIKNVYESTKLMSDVLPKECHHYKHQVVEFDPEANQVTLSNGKVVSKEIRLHLKKSDNACIDCVPEKFDFDVCRKGKPANWILLSYRFLVVSLGLQLNYDRVEGLPEALKADPMVCSNYWRESVEKTYPALQAFKGGNAIFTFPNTPVKCAGAPQKIMYLADEFWRKQGVRDQTNIMFKTSLGLIFGVKKYADKLVELTNKRNIAVEYKRSLVAIDHTKKEATFQKLETEDLETETVKYDFIHVPPPMSAPDVLKNSKASIVDAAGFLDVTKETMQHAKYPNIFGLGDCTNIPTSKTAAAIASQNKVLAQSVEEVMKNQKPTGGYDGYTACPIVTGYKTCIMAEFDFNMQPLETFPFDQGKERRSMFYVKKDVFPRLYWKALTTGRWAGPKHYRKLMHFGLSK